MRKTASLLCLLVMLLASPAMAQTKETRAKIEQITAYVSEGKKAKADKVFNEVLRDLPNNKSVILNTAYMLRSRMLYDYALEVLSKGAEINTEGEKFYMERASICQSMNNMAFSTAFREVMLPPDCASAWPYCRLACVKARTVTFSPPLATSAYNRPLP